MFSIKNMDDGLYWNGHSWGPVRVARLYSAKGRAVAQARKLGKAMIEAGSKTSKLGIVEWVEKQIIPSRNFVMSQLAVLGKAGHSGVLEVLDNFGYDPMPVEKIDRYYLEPSTEDESRQAIEQDGDYKVSKIN